LFKFLFLHLSLDFALLMSYLFDMPQLKLIMILILTKMKKLFYLLWD